jgi:hypothetical protein
MLDERLARSDPDGVIDALGNLRRADPAWRSDAEPALARREHRARRALGQDALADLLFRDLVRKTGAPRASAFALVRELIAEGQRDVALTLARSVVALLPGDRAAARLLQEAELPSAGESRLPDA